MRRSILVQLVLVLALPLMAATAQEKVIVSSDAAKLFKAPGFDGVGSPVVRGQTLTVLERKGDWVHVYDGKADGFVHNAFLTAAQPAAPAAPVQQPQAYAPPPAYPPQPAYPPPGAYPPGYQPAYAQPANGPQLARMPGTMGYKDPNTARIFSIVIPGGGQFYSGEVGKGTMILGVGLAGLILPSVLIASDANDCLNSFDEYGYSDCANATSSWGTAALIGYGVWFTAWIYGIVDADNAAMRTNMKPMHFGVAPILNSDGKRVYGGLQLKFR